MATSARASAHAPSPSEPSAIARAESLALQASDDIDSLQVVRRAYACLEKLISPHHVNDTEEVYPTRTEFSALVWLVNEELRRRIEAADATIQSLRVALSEDGRNGSLQRKPTWRSNRRCFCIGRSRCRWSGASRAQTRLR